MTQAPRPDIPRPDIWRPGQVEERPLHALLPAAANARTHGAAQLRKLARSIAAFGFTSPVLVDAAGRIVAGHGRVAAARQLGMATVPTVRLDHLTPAQCRALALADNRIAEQAGWDRRLLRVELRGLLTLDDSFDLSLTGFEDAEIDIALDDALAPGPAEPGAAALDPAADPDPGPAVSRPGDLWILGRHALLCGDLAAPGVLAALLAPALLDPAPGPAAMLFAAPPEPGPGLRAALAAAVAASRPGSLHYLCLDWRRLGGLAAAAEGLYAGQADLCVWDKGAAKQAGPGSPYRPQHALVAVYRTPGTGPEPAPRRSAGGRRPRGNLWRHPAGGAAGPPAELVADAIRDATRPGEAVLDPWGGGGGTLLAAERTGRSARLAEPDPRRADHAVRRWQAATGGTATLTAPGGDAGETFAATARHRSREALHAG